jgi:hypothetical protein
MKRRKIWVGLGTAVFAASPAAAGAATEAALSQRPAVEAKAGHAALMKLAQHKGHGAEGGKVAASGGEGDEGGGTAATELPAPLRFYRDIGLIRGHLLVGNELVEAGRWAEALPHFLHPEEEIYPGMRENLKTFNVGPFQTALKALSQTVKAKNKEAYSRARTALEERLAAAEASVRGKETNVPYFTLETVMEILQTASSEYEEALKGTRIANVIEYQDARGFVFEADRLIAAQADGLAAKNADAVKAIRASLSDLKSAFPAAMPPKQAVKDHGQFLSDLSKIELQLGALR